MNHLHTVNRELETLEVRKQQTTYITSKIMYICTYLLAFIRIILSLIYQGLVAEVKC